MHGANRICTRASLRFHEEGGSRVKEKEEEEEADMAEGEGGGERVNRICMETVCQWVASSCGYLTLFSLPLFPLPNHLRSTPIFNRSLVHPLSLSPPPFRSPPLPISLLFLNQYVVSFLFPRSRSTCTTGKLLFLNSSIILPRLTW